MGIIYFALFILMLIVIYQIHKTLLVPSTIVAVTWALFPAMASWGVLDLYSLSIETHTVILLGLLSFMLGYYSTLPRKRIDIGGTRQEEIDSVDETLSYSGYVNYKLLIVINAIIIAWLGSHFGFSLSLIQSR